MNEIECKKNNYTRFMTHTYTHISLSQSDSQSKIEKQKHQL